MNFFDRKFTELHNDKDQFMRQLRAVELKKMDSVNVDQKTGQIIGKIGNCTVSLEKCSCLDFNKRHKPCKHMYRLAMDLKIFSIETPTVTVSKRYSDNEILRKVFDVEHGLFSVQFTKYRFGIKAHCSCPAGKYKTLCRHVMQCISEDDEIAEIIQSEGLLDLYEEYMSKLEEAEKLKNEAKSLKKKFARLLLE